MIFLRFFRELIYVCVYLSVRTSKNHAVKIENYGNVRFARNIVEIVELNRTENLAKKYKGLNQLSNEQLFTLRLKNLICRILVKTMMLKEKGI